MSYLNRKEVEEQFDEKFIIIETGRINGPATGSGEYRSEILKNDIYGVREFIKTQRTQDLDSLIEHGAGMKRGKVKDEEPMWEAHYRGYDEGVSDFISHLQALREQNK